MAGDLNLSNLQPAQPRKDRKRVGRGLGSGKGRYSGRGIKGQKSRAGSHAMRAGFEGGQMPLYMRTAKLRGNTSADAMPVGPFRTYTQPVNLRDLEARFEVGEEVTPESLKAKGLIRSLRKDVKLLGVGELTKKLSITVHGASATAREKVEAAGGTPVGPVFGMTGDAQGTVWAASVERGLWRVRGDVAERVPTPFPDLFRVLGARDGLLWTGSFANGVVPLSGGSVRAVYGPPAGIGPGHPSLYAPGDPAAGSP